MKIILTGATSFLGRAAADLLESRGHEVIRFRHSVDEDAGAAGTALPAQADAFVHFAWGGKGSAGRSDPAIQEKNVEMSLRALRKAQELGCRKFIFAGSQAEYGGVHTLHADRRQHEGVRDVSQSSGSAV